MWNVFVICMCVRVCHFNKGKNYMQTLVKFANFFFFLNVFPIFGNGIFSYSLLFHIGKAITVC